jgi:hypothetical protein
MSVDDHGSQLHRFQSAERVLLVGCAVLLGLVVMFGSLLLVRHEQQYVRLAESFLSGKLHLLVELPEHLHDTALYGGRYYWPLGPFPAVLLMPFVLVCRWIGVEFYQAYASLPLSLWTSWLIFRLASKCGRSKVESVWLALAFCGASSYPSVAAISMSWPFAQVVAIHLLFLALHEWLGQKRWLVIGLLLGLTAATRLSAGLNIGLFAVTALMPEPLARKRALLSLTLGFAMPIALLALYNFARFDSVLETGYRLQPPGPGDFPSTSLANVLPHLNLFLFGPPALSDKFPFVITQAIGMSVFLLSPWFCYLGSLKLDRFSLVALLNCLVVLVTVLAWRSNGQFQLGYRFSLDFLPVVIFLIARNGFHGGPLPARFKLLTVVGFVFTLYFFWSFIAILPHR